MAYFDKLRPSCVHAGVRYDGPVVHVQEENEEVIEVKALQKKEIEAEVKTGFGREAMNEM